MNPRKLERGFDFPSNLDSAEATREGDRDARLRMDSIPLNSLEAMIIRMGLGRSTELLRSISHQGVLNPDQLGDFVEALKAVRRDEHSGERIRKLDRIISKCRESERKGLPVFADL